MAKETTNLDDEKAKPRGDRGDGETGVPPNEQGISNRPGDTEDGEEEEEEQEEEDHDEDEPPHK